MGFSQACSSKRTLYSLLATRINLLITAFIITFDSHSEKMSRNFRQPRSSNRFPHPEMAMRINGLPTTSLSIFDTRSASTSGFLTT
jgi:hypothetical protein